MTFPGYFIGMRSRRKRASAIAHADDMVVMCRSHEEAAGARSKLHDWMEGAGLTLHPDKSRVPGMNLAGSHFDFLGCRFYRIRRGRLCGWERPKSLRFPCGGGERGNSMPRCYRCPMALLFLSKRIG